MWLNQLMYGKVSSRCRPKHSYTLKVYPLTNTRRAYCKIYPKNLYKLSQSLTIDENRDNKVTTGFTSNINGFGPFPFKTLKNAKGVGKKLYSIVGL